MNRVQLFALLAGFTLLVTGATLIYHPLGFLVAGTGLLLVGLPKKAKK